MRKEGLYKEPTFVDTLKSKLLDVATEYIKRNFEKTKNDVFRYVENIIEKKLKKEIRKYIYTTSAYILFSLGSLFLIYGFIATIIYLLQLPQFLSTIFFGSLLIIIGIFVLILR